MGRVGITPFPLPAHQTGRADFRHPAFRVASLQGTRWTARLSWCLATTPRRVTAFALRQSSLGSFRIHCGVARLIANHRSSASSKAHHKSGSFAPPALPSLNARMTLSDSRPARRACHDVGGATSGRNGYPPITRTTLPACRAHYPGGPGRVLMSVASPSRAAFPT